MAALKQAKQKKRKTSNLCANKILGTRIIHQISSSCNLSLRTINFYFSKIQFSANCKTKEELELKIKKSHLYKKSLDLK